MEKFRKKAVIIDAVKWLGDFGAIKHMLPIRNVTYVQHDDELIIHTLEGDMTASLNDWIIQGVKGEIYPCKPDIFEMTYEKVTEI